MTENNTQSTGDGVEDSIAARANTEQRVDCKALSRESPSSRRRCWSLALSPISMFILIVILTMLAATRLVANAQPVGKVPTVAGGW